MQFNVNFCVIYLVSTVLAAQINYFDECARGKLENLCKNNGRISVRKLNVKREEFYCIFVESGHEEEDSLDGRDKIEILMSSDKWKVIGRNVLNPHFSSKNFSFTLGHTPQSKVVIKQKNNEILPELTDLNLNSIEVCFKTLRKVETPTRLKFDVTAVPKCGILSYGQDNKLVLGDRTDIEKWPWHAAIYGFDKDFKSMYRCGGVLVNERTVVTSASCVKSSDINYQVKVGESDVFSVGDDGTFKVDKIILHPNFYLGNLTNDIALLKLHQPVILSNSVQPVCLPDSSDITIDGKEGITVGFGYDENGKFSQHLKQADLTAESYFKCLVRNRDFYSRFAISNSFCAGNKLGKGICVGDKGNGFFSKGLDDQYYLYGIASHAPVDFELNSYCRVKDSGIFVHVSKFTNWIKENFFE